MSFLRDKDIDYEIYYERDTTHYVGNCSAYDEETDRKEEKRIRDLLADGHSYAWCRITVVANLKVNNSITATESIGACSYNSDAELRGSDEVIELKSQCKYDLEKQILDLMELTDCRTNLQREFRRAMKHANKVQEQLNAVYDDSLNWREAVSNGIEVFDKDGYVFCKAVFVESEGDDCFPTYGYWEKAD